MYTPETSTFTLLEAEKLVLGNWEHLYHKKNTHADTQPPLTPTVVAMYFAKLYPWQDFYGYSLME